MPDTIYKWNLDGYIAVQLMCCFKWKLGGFNGFCNTKLGVFYGKLTPVVREKISPTIERLQYEFYQDINRTVYTDLQLFCKMIPAEYRQDAWNNCKEILRANPLKMDEIIYKRLEKGLT